MTASDQIFAHIKRHGRATRPELERVYGLCEKTVDSAIRKLERLGYIKRAGIKEREWRKRPTVVFVLADVSADLKLVGDCRGRPRLTVKPALHHSNDALESAMAAFFGRAA